MTISCGLSATTLAHHVAKSVNLWIINLAYILSLFNSPTQRCPISLSAKFKILVWPSRSYVIRLLHSFSTSFPSSLPQAILQAHCAAYSAWKFLLDYHLGIRILISPSWTTTTSTDTDSKFPPSTRIPVAILLAVSVPREISLCFQSQFSTHSDPRFPIPFHCPSTVWHFPNFSWSQLLLPHCTSDFWCISKNLLFGPWLHISSVVLSSVSPFWRTPEALNTIGQCHSTLLDTILSLNGPRSHSGTTVEL